MSSSKKRPQILTNQKFLSPKMLDDKIMLMVTQIKTNKNQNLLI